MSKELRDKLNILPKSKTIPTGSTKLNKIKPNNNCKLIAIYGSNLGSNIGFKLNNISLNGIYLTPIIEQILVGILLGDANIRRSGKKGQPQIQYNQGFLHLNHILHLYFLLSPILTHLPSLIQQRDFSRYLHIHTRCLLCLNPLYDLFIKNGVKTISPSLIN